MKIVILGNSGSGKTWLGERLATVLAVPVVHLDELFWQPGGFDRKRAAPEVALHVAQHRSLQAWVVEGVFGELALPFLSDAHALVWLDLDWPTCRRRLLTRGSESKAHMDRVQSAAGLTALIDWASNYATRGDSRSLDGHRRLFENFSGTRRRLCSEEEVNLLVTAAAQTGVAAALQGVQAF